MAKDQPSNLEDELQSAISEGGDPVADQAPPPVEPPPETPPGTPPGSPVEPPPGDQPPVLVQRKWDSEPPQEPQETETTEPVTELLGKIKDQYGADLSGKYSDDDALLHGLLNASSLVGKRDDDASKWRQFAENPEGYLQQWGYAKAGQPQPPPEQPTGGTPEYDEQWQNQVTRDPATGEVTGAKAGHDPAIAHKLRAAEQWAAQRQKQMLFNPEEVFGPMLQEKFKEFEDRAQKRSSEQIAAASVQQEAWNWINDDKNKQWIFEEGNPHRGLSPQGQRFYEYVRQGTEQEGIPETDMNRLVQYATKEMELEWYRSQTNQRQPPSSPPTTAMQGTNVAPQGEDRDLAIQKDESVHDAMRRITGV